MTLNEPSGSCVCCNHVHGFDNRRHIQSDQPYGLNPRRTEQRVQQSLNQIMGSSILRNLESRRDQRAEPREEERLEPTFSLPTVRRFWSTEEEDGSNEPEELRLTDNTFNGPVVG